MEFEDIHQQVGGIPYIEAENARYLYDLIIRERPKRVLELGIAHGTSTCYIAAALEEVGGHCDAVDLLSAADEFKPSAEEQLAATSLAGSVDIHRMKTGYNWFLHDRIAENSRALVCQEMYDLCIIDGPKNWTIDGAAFFMAEKLLKRGGWMVFDDYDWSYAEADSRRDSTDGIEHASLSDEERETPHIREVFHLLVRQHPNFRRAEVGPVPCWAVAKKTRSNHPFGTLFHGGLRKLTRGLR